VAPAPHPSGAQIGQTRPAARRSTRAWVRALASWWPQVGQLAIQTPPSRWRSARAF